MKKTKVVEPAQPVDVARVEAALQHASEVTGAFQSPVVTVPLDATPAAEPEKKSWRNPDDDIKREAESVAALVQTLTDMGISCAESIEASINSETNFREMVEARLKVEGEIDAMVSGLKGYIETLQERVKKFEAAKASIRQVLCSAFVNAGQSSLPTAYGTVYTKPGSYSLKVTNEALIGSSFYKWSLDNTALKDRLTERRKAEEAVNAIKDDAERAEARREFEEKYPPIEGAELQQGNTTINIRRK